MKKLILFALPALFCYSEAKPQVFKTHIPSNVLGTSFTGHVLLYLSRDNRNPKDGTIGFEELPCYSVAVENVRPGGDVVIDDKAVSYPVVLSSLSRGTYYAQVVWDRNLGGRSIAESPGNIYNNTQRVEFTRDLGKTFQITCDQVLAAPVFKETAVADDLSKFSYSLQSLAHKNICVTGVIALYKGRPEIIVHDPNQIKSN